MPSSSPDYIVLARKYRPQCLHDVVGQEILVEALDKAINDHKLSHGIILHGIRGIGKTTTARIIAKGLNCEKGPTVNPCGVCASCEAIQWDRHLDVIEMDAASHTGVDDMREIIETAKYRAVQGRFKVYIIDEVHMLSKSAFNALLKTLEEPPPSVQFIFATTELQKVPDTILSRCMRFDLKPMDNNTLRKRMAFIATQENLMLDDDASALIARAAEGSMRDALSLLDQAIVVSKDRHITSNVVQGMLGLSSFEATTSLLKGVFEGQELAIFTQTEELYRQGKDPLLLLKDLLERTYQLIYLKTTPSSFQRSHAEKEFFTEHEKDLLGPLSHNISMPSLLQVWTLLNDRYQKVDRSPFPKHSLQVSLLEVCYVSQLPPLKDILETLSSADQKEATILPQSSASNPMVIDSSKNNSPEKDDSTTTSFSSFHDILHLLEEKREPLLYTHALKEISVASFSNGHIKAYTKPSAPPGVLVRLKQFLDTHTQHRWDIADLGVNKNAPSLQDEKIRHDTQKYEESLQHPVVQSILTTFHGSAILPKKEGDL